MQEDKLRTIKLYGDLGKAFGREHKFVCNDAAGAVRALCTMIEGFRDYMVDGQQSYKVMLDEDVITTDEIHLPSGACDIVIAPVVAGSKSGFFGGVLGAVLIGAAFITGGASLAGGALAFSGAAGTAAVMLGGALLFAGVSQLLTPQQKGLGGVDSPDNGASYNFNGVVNVTAQGNPVPILLGQAIVGSVTISADMYAEDKQ